MGQKRAERLELPPQKSPAVSAYFGVWVRHDFRGFFRQSKTPADRSLTGVLWSCYPDSNWRPHPYQHTEMCPSGAIRHCLGVFLPIWVVYNGIPPTVSTQFFRVWVRVWVKSQNSKQRHGHKDIEPPSKFAPQNKEKLFFALKTQSKPESPPRPRWTA